MTRYDEQHLREILATIRAPEGLRERRPTVIPDESTAPTSPARPPWPRWLLPVVIGAAAAGLMFGTVSVANRVAQPSLPPGSMPAPSGSILPPSITRDSGQPSSSAPPARTATASPSPGPRSSGPSSPAPAPGSTVKETPLAPGVGVPPGTNLTVHTGDLHVTTAGVTVSNMFVVGTIYVDAPNVTLVAVRASPPDNYFGIKQQPGATNLTVRDSEVVGNPQTPTQYGISQSAATLTVTRVLIRQVESGIALGGGNVTVTASRIDELVGVSPTGIGSNGETPNLNFSNNTILIDSDTGGAIVLYVTSGPYETVTIQGNTLAGGATTLIAGQGPSSHDIRVLNNQFSRMYFPNCGSTAPVREFDPAEPGNQWSNNVWADTGLPVNF